MYGLTWGSPKCWCSPVVRLYGPSSRLNSKRLEMSVVLTNVWSRAHYTNIRVSVYMMHFWCSFLP
jgi:hypothetical protein